MSKLQFKFYNQAQGELFPSFLGEKIPETHHVRLLSGIVDALDITDLLETYKSFGCPAYHPRMLLKVVFYAYMNNIYSCCKIEELNGQNRQLPRETKEEKQAAKAKAEQRTIEVDHNLNGHKRKAREMPTSEEGLRHRSRRPMEPEAVFGQIKFDWHYKRFRHKGKDKVHMDFAKPAMAHNPRKLMRKAQNELTEGIFAHLLRLCKPCSTHTAFLELNDRNYRIAV